MMELDLPKPGKYVVAVSGGVDSVTLLHVLKDVAGSELVVAHFDHGIRPDSNEDRQLVERLAERYRLPFYYEAGGLGSHASEALAREKRYDFLEKTRRQVGAKAIITAHHQDDRLETAILNMLRGTGRRGLSSLKNRQGIIRPLLHVSKEEIRNYAQSHNLEWREDSTNTDERYLRNYIRQQILSRFTASDKARLLHIIERATGQNRAIDQLLENSLSEHAHGATLERQWLVGLPHEVSLEVLLAWLRSHGVRGLDRRQTERLVVLAKTLERGKLIDVDAAFQLKVEAKSLALIPRER